jgi:lipopolysaccharide transport system ATP-binding protein
MPEVLIKVENVSKKFCRELKRSLWYGVLDLKNEIIGNYDEQKIPELRKGEFWVNQNISFEVKRGECLGLIGKNGAGKSTLLKILTGLIKPDSGLIELHGRVGALIELGAGFNPILTGKENVFNNGALLGFSKKEMEAKYDEIVAFAELEEFMETPVQYYSSGMKVRLGFAVATHIEPDVLILDEVLAVGDAAFRAKCYNRIGQLRQKAAMIFVSHSMQQVSQICTSVLALEKGEIKWLGDVGGGVSVYNTQNSSTSDDEKEENLVIAYPVKSANLSFSTLNIEHGERIHINLELDLLESIIESCIRIVFYNTEGQVVSEWNSKKNNMVLNFKKGQNRLSINIGPFYLRSGKFKIGFVLNDNSGIYVPFWSFKQYTLVVTGDFSGACEYQLPAASELNFI